MWAFFMVKKQNETTTYEIAQLLIAQVIENNKLKKEKMIKVISLKAVTKFAEGLMKKEPSIGLSRLAREIGLHPFGSYFGDYVVLGHSLKLLNERGVRIERQQITRALNNSEELSKLSKKNKTAVLNNLVNAQNCLLEKLNC